MGNHATIQSKWNTLSRIATWLFFIAALGCGQGDLPEVDEFTNQTYEQYKNGYFDEWIDLQGASNIYSATAFNGDGYEVWWRFIVSEDDFKKIIISAAKPGDMSEQIVFEDVNSIPPNWKPDSDPPHWWAINETKDTKSVHWCYLAGDAERYRGWFFYMTVRRGPRSVGIGIINGRAVSASDIKTMTCKDTLMPGWKPGGRRSVRVLPHMRYMAPQKLP